MPVLYDTDIPYSAAITYGGDPAGDPMSSATKLRTEIVTALLYSPDLAWVMLPGNLLAYPSSFTQSRWTSDVGMTVVDMSVQDPVNGALWYSSMTDTSASAALKCAQVFTPATTGVHTIAVDVEAVTNDCPRLTVAGTGFPGGDIAAVYWDPSDTSAHADAVYAPSSIGAIDVDGGFHGRVRLWMQVSLTAGTLYSMSLRPAGCALGGPYTLTASLTATAQFANAAVIPGTSTTFPTAAIPPRVFEGDVGLSGGRNLGRLPFIEAWVSQRFNQESQEGGYLQSVAKLRAHVGGTPTNSGTALALLDSVMAVAVMTVRNMTDSVNGAPKYAFEGDTRLSEPKVGPFGWQQDAELDVGLEYDSTNFGYT